MTEKRTPLQVFHDLQKLLKLSKLDLINNMGGNVSAGIRVRHNMSEVNRLSLLLRKLILDQNGKYYIPKRIKGIIPKRFKNWLLTKKGKVNNGICIQFKY